MVDKTLMLNFKELRKNNLSIMEFLFLANKYFKNKLEIPIANINLNTLQDNK
jgi:hypothetical protein